MTLDDDERAMLDLERSWWQHPGAKEQAIRDRFGVSAVTFYQRLNQLIDTEAALAHDPVLVRRLQRVRSARLGRRRA